MPNSRMRRYNSGGGLAGSTLLSAISAIADDPNSVKITNAPITADGVTSFDLGNGTYANYKKPGIMRNILTQGEAGDNYRNSLQNMLTQQQQQNFSKGEREAGQNFTTNRDKQLFDYETQRLGNKFNQDKEMASINAGNARNALNDHTLAVRRIIASDDNVGTYNKATSPYIAESGATEQQSGIDANRANSALSKEKQLIAEQGTAYRTANPTYTGDMMGETLTSNRLNNIRNQFTPISVEDNGGFKQIQTLNKDLNGVDTRVVIMSARPTANDSTGQPLSKIAFGNNGGEQQSNELSDFKIVPKSSVAKPVFNSETPMLSEPAPENQQSQNLTPNPYLVTLSNGLKVSPIMATDYQAATNTTLNKPPVYNIGQQPDSEIVEQPTTIKSALRRLINR